MRSIRIRFAVAAAMVLASIGSASAADKVRMYRTSDNFTLIQFMMADAGGYFEKENIEADIIRGAGGSPGVAALLKGDIDIYAGSTAPILQAAAQGAELRIFGALTTEFITDVVVSKAWAQKQGVQPDAPLAERLKLLRGITIAALDHGGGSNQIIQHVSKMGGLSSEKDFSIVVIPQGTTMLAALTQGRVDGFSSSAPISTRALAEGDAMFLARPSIGEIEDLKGYLYINLTTRKDWLDKNQDVARRLLKAVKAAVTDYRDSTKTNELREKVWAKFYSGVDKAIFASAWNDNVAAAPKNVTVAKEQFEQVIKFENEFLPKKLDVALADKLFDESFAKQVTEESLK